MTTAAGRSDTVDDRARAVRWTRRAGLAGRFVVGLAVPTALYYLLRSLGVSVYASLIVSTLVSAAPGLWSMVRYRRFDGLSVYFSAMMLGGLGVSLLPGSTRFLLAREALMTGVTGIWFLVSAGLTKPLTYHFTRPLMEGRLHWPGDWDDLWMRSSRFRRMWRVSSVLFGVSLLGDAVIRVVLAYTVDPDRVPALGLALYVGTAVAVNVVVSIYYVLCRVQDPGSPLRRGDAEPQ